MRTRTPLSNRWEAFADWVIVAEHEAFSVRMAGTGSESGPTPDSSTVLIEIVNKLELVGSHTMFFTG